MTLDQMRVFIAVAETGSFRGAAARLGRVQSAISHAIGNLEAELRLDLFDRSGHRPALTPEGQVLLADARAVLLKADAMRARARGVGEGVELELTIVVDTLFRLPRTSAALLEMHRIYPSVCVRLAFEPLGGPIVALLERRCRIGITVGEHFRDQDVVTEPIEPVSLIPVVSAVHPLAPRARVGKPLSSTDLADHLQIVLEDPTTLTRGRDIGVLSPGTWRVGSQQAKYELIVAGAGWGRLPLWVVENDLAAGRLLRLPTVTFGTDGETAVLSHFMRRTDEPLGRAARAFRDALFGQDRPAGELL